MNTTNQTLAPCRWCGMHHQTVCPMVKAIEYHPNGAVKRVEFKSGADFPSVNLPDGPKPPWTVTCEAPRKNAVPMEQGHITRDY